MKLALILAMLAAVVLAGLAGCANTPQARYDVAKLEWAGVKAGIYAYTSQNPVPAATGQLIVKNLNAGDQNLKDAQTWLAANPTTANTPGASGPPSLSDLNIAESFLNSFIPDNNTIVVIKGAPSTVSVTQPAK